MNNQKFPKFKRGQSVWFNKERCEEINKHFNEIQKKYPNENLGNRPTGKLIIESDPRWNGETFIYDYVYGFCGTSEGSAKEEDFVN